MVKLIFSILLFPAIIFSQTIPQTDLDRGLRIGEIIINGLSILKNGKKTENTESSSKTVSSICVKNKLASKISFTLKGNFKEKEDEEPKEIKKELVIQPEGKECLYEVNKGIWQYEILNANNETYKKGEYKIEEEILITAKE